MTKRAHTVAPGKGTKMNTIAAQASTLPEPTTDDFDGELVESPEGYQLKELKTKHKQVLSLVAQGIKNIDVAALCHITPQYVTMLLRMPICRSYLQEMNEAAQVQLDSMFTQTVDTIRNGMETGNVGDQLKAARLQLEATGRIGSNSGTPLQQTGNDDRLERLANRLIDLMADKQTGSTYDGEVQQASSGSEPEGVQRVNGSPNSTA